MANKKAIIEELNISGINRGKIIQREEKYFIIMDKLLHTFPEKEILGYYTEEMGDLVYDEFLIYFQHEIPYIEKYSLKIEEKVWSILLKIPFKMIEIKNQNLVKDMKILIKYDEKLNSAYFLVETNTHYYKIYDFMEADYEIFSDIPFNNKYRFVEGTQYLKKTGYTLKTFYKKEFKI